jgi:hypothetical protein
LFPASLFVKGDTGNVCSRLFGPTHLSLQFHCWSQ